jgi:tol-pal system protein YbgF
MYDHRTKTSRMASPALAILALASVISSPALAQDAEQSVAANLVIQVQELQDEVRMLRGQIEEQEKELENLKRRQRDQYLDLDQRISDMRSNQPVSSLPSSGPRQPAVSQRTEDVPEVRAPMESQSEVTGIGTPEVQSQSAAATAADEKAAYDHAFQALKDLRYADAAEEFTSFLDRYPGSEYADNAQYWLGESYYVTRNFDIALAAFQDLMEKYPDSSKVPDALLKVGYTNYELEQWDQARAALTRVQEEYPDTTLARLAESRLRSMRMEGHY